MYLAVPLAAEHGAGSKSRCFGDLPRKRCLLPAPVWPSGRAGAYSRCPGRPDGRPAAGRPRSETGDGGEVEGAPACRTRRASGSAARGRRDHAGARSRHRSARGPAALDRSSAGASPSGRAPVRAARAGLAATGCAGDPVLPDAIHFVRVQGQLEPVSDKAREEAADRVQLKLSSAITIVLRGRSA